MYTLICLKQGVSGNYMHNYPGTLLECLRMAGRLYRRLGQVSDIQRADGTSIRRPSKRLPLPGATR